MPSWAHALARKQMPYGIVLSVVIASISTQEDAGLPGQAYASCTDSRDTLLAYYMCVKVT